VRIVLKKHLSSTSTSAVHVFSTHYYLNLECLTVGTLVTLLKFNTTFNNGSLGSRIDEERSEMR
jgi:hypothetical protein